jgi:hypothetical protein
MAASRIEAAMRVLPLLVVILAVASCVAPTAPRPRPAPAPIPTPVYTPPPPRPTPVALPLGKDWRDWPVTPGDWVYRQDGRGSIALFGERGADALLTLRCDRAAGTIYLSRSGLATGAAPMTIRTTTLLRTLPGAPTGGTPPYIAVALAPRDGLLDAIGFSRGRFVIEQAGYPTLVVPAWAEIERVTEDCRR